MRRKALAILLATALLVAGASALGIVAPAAADKGGCPSEAASNGTAHANANSAHGAEKQATRSCLNGKPTPTPTPIPSDEADVRVTNVSVNAPDTASVGERFAVFVGVSLINDGPADEVIVDTTVELAVPLGCSLSSSSPRTVEDTLLKKDQGVFVGIGWYVTCSQAGTFTLTANATANIDPALSNAIDPDSSNNTGSGSDTTDIHS